MLKEISAKDTASFEAYLKSREQKTSDEVVKLVNDIIENVRTNKDKALFEYNEKFDKVSLTTLKVTNEEIEEAIKQVDPSFLAAMEEAAENIRIFHEPQLRKGYEIKKDNGVILGSRVIPLEKVGVYVPGGRAAYPSTVLMNVIPAKIAGVDEIIMVTPPSKDGSINPYILAAAKIAGVTQIYKVGGAQAIAALAFGTESIPRVDKIVGPGNQFVATAKRLVYGIVDIDMIAGPSEILVIADENANPAYTAADLLSQAEHDPLACSILVTTSRELLEKVNVELRKQTDVLPRKAIVEDSLANYGTAIVCTSLEECAAISNAIAPEHLELQVKDSFELLKQIRNAGSVFLGYVTCESLGDYFCGTNHVLPTSGTARFSSPLNVNSFVKTSSYSYYPMDALKKDGPKIVTIADYEGLRAHAHAVEVRLDEED